MVAGSSGRWTAAQEATTLLGRLRKRKTNISWAPRIYYSPRGGRRHSSSASSQATESPLVVADSTDPEKWLTPITVAGNAATPPFAACQSPPSVLDSSPGLMPYASNLERDLERGTRPPHGETATTEHLASLSTVYFPITAVSACELEPGPITEIARALAAMDHGVLLFRYGEEPFLGENRAYGHTLRALEDGLSGRERFHSLYPSSSGFEPYWRSTLHSASTVRQPGGVCTGSTAHQGPRWDTQTRGVFQNIETKAESLRALVFQKKQMYLPRKDRLQSAIEGRWRLLVDILDAIYHGSDTKRKIAEWDDFISFEDTFAWGIESVAFSPQLGAHLGDAGETPGPGIHGSDANVEVYGGSSTETGVFSKYITSILWLTFLAAVPLSIVAFALALKYSEPTAGTTTDGDFWLLFQNCGMQLVSLASIVAPVWGGKVVTGHARVALLVFIGVAGMSTIMAPFCYVRLPKAWSGFVVITSGCINAFATLQMALAMHRAEDKS